MGEGGVGGREGGEKRRREGRREKRGGGFSKAFFFFFKPLFVDTVFLRCNRNLLRKCAYVCV